MVSSDTASDSSSGSAQPWLSATRPCRADPTRAYILTVSPATAAGFFQARAIHEYNAVVCLGCDALVQRGVRRSMLLNQLRRPVEIFLEYPLAYEPSREQFAASEDDSPSSAAVWKAANCSIIKVAKLKFPHLNASHPGVGLSSSRVLQHIHCGLQVRGI